MQRPVNLTPGTGKMKTKPGQNTNEFNCVDSMVPLTWTPVLCSKKRAHYQWWLYSTMKRRIRPDGQVKKTSFYPQILSASTVPK
jgi:hypothetical protein